MSEPSPPKLTLRQRFAKADVSFFAYFGARIGSGIAGIFMLKLLITFLSKEDYALWGYYRTFGRMFVPVLTLSVPAAMMRMYFDKKSESAEVQSPLITTVFMLCTGGAVLMAAVGALLYMFTDEELSYLIFFLVVAPAGVFISFFDYLTRARNNYLLYMVNRIMESIGFALLLWGVILYEANASITEPLIWTIGIYGVCIWSVLLGNTAFYLKQGYLTSPRALLPWKEIRALLAFSAPLTGTYFLGWALHSSDIYIMKKFSTGLETADYIFAVGIAGFVGMVTSAALNDWPRFFYATMRDNPEDRDQRITKRISMVLLMHVGAILVIRIIVSFAYDLLGAEEYTAGIDFIGVLVLANFFFLFGNIAAAGIGLVKKTKLTLITFAVPGVVNLGLNLWLIPQYGAFAAACTTLIAFMIFSVLSYVLGRPHYQIKGGLKLGAIIALAMFVALVPVP